MIAQLQQRASPSGSFVNRAVVREIKMAFTRLARTPAGSEVARLAERWEKGMPDVEVLDDIRGINRAANCWKTEVPSPGS
jgi:hypothetical protein